jgi:hypothetical protein
MKFAHEPAAPLNKQEDVVGPKKNGAGLLFIS